MGDHSVVYECPHTCCTTGKLKPGTPRSYANLSSFRTHLEGKPVKLVRHEEVKPNRDRWSEHQTCAPACPMYAIRNDTALVEQRGRIVLRGNGIPSLGASSDMKVDAWSGHDDRPLVMFQDDPGHLFRHYGYALFQPTDLSRGLAEQLYQLVHDQPFLTALEAMDSVEEIAGGVTQLPLHVLKTHATYSAPLSTILQQWRNIVADKISSLQDAAAPPLQEHVKVLVATPGKGRQIPHWDAPPSEAKSATLTVLMYCSPSLSTYVPRYPTRLLSVPPDEPAAMRSRSYLLDEAFFHAEPVQPGAMLVIRQTVPHFGSENCALDHDRVVFFDMCSPFNVEHVKGQDEYSYSVYNYLFDACESPVDILRYAASLLQYEAHHPFERHTGQVRALIRNKTADAWAAFTAMVNPTPSRRSARG